MRFVHISFPLDPEHNEVGSLLLLQMRGLRLIRLKFSS